MRLLWYTFADEEVDPLLAAACGGPEGRGNATWDDQTVKLLYDGTTGAWPQWVVGAETDLCAYHENYPSGYDTNEGLILVVRYGVENWLADAKVNMRTWAESVFGGSEGRVAWRGRLRPSHDQWSPYPFASDQHYQYFVNMAIDEEYAANEAEARDLWRSTLRSLMEGIITIWNAILPNMIDVGVYGWPPIVNGYLCNASVGQVETDSYTGVSLFETLQTEHDTHFSWFWPFMAANKGVLVAQCYNVYGVVCPRSESSPSDGWIQAHFNTDLVYSGMAEAARCAVENSVPIEGWVTPIYGGNIVGACPATPPAWADDTFPIDQTYLPPGGDLTYNARGLWNGDMPTIPSMAAHLGFSGLAMWNSLTGPDSDPVYGPRVVEEIVPAIARYIPVLEAARLRSIRKAANTVAPPMAD